MTDAANGLSPLKRALVAIETLERRLAEREESIAVVGIGCRFPGGADGPDAFWRLLRDGVDAIGAVPADRWDARAVYDPDPDAPGKTYARGAGFLSGRVDAFDAEFFGIAPREVIAMDPQQRLLLEVAWEALEHAGHAPDRLHGGAAGVFVGIASDDYASLQTRHADLGAITPHYAAGVARSVAAGRLSYVLGLQGPALTVDTACSSSLVAVHLACQSLRAGECRIALAGGVNLLLAPDNGIAFARSRMLAPDGRSKTFDAGADGFADGEGCGLVVLKRVSEAMANGDRILAVIRGTAVNQDGASSGLTAPNGPAQQAVIRRALAAGGVLPSAVDYVEAHGTGTVLGDPIEVQALAAELGEGRSPDRPLLIGSVKTNIGHLEAAAGVAGLIKVILALHHEAIPPHLHFRTPNPHIPWERLPVAVTTQPVPWPRSERPRLAGVSSFGFSGTNAHVVVQEAPTPTSGPVATPERPRHVLALSAKTETALQALAERWSRALAAPDEVDVRDVCFTANVGRAHFSHRAVAVVESSTDVHEVLSAVASGQPRAGTHRARLLGPDPPRIAFLFTGQGAQYAGMGRDLYDGEPVFRDALDRCQELCRPFLDRPLLSVLYPEPGQSTPIDQTAYAQPALFAVEYALARLWRAWGVEPRVVLGHSVGEYAAACVAGVLAVEDAVRLVATRGRLMQALPPDGAMAAVFAPEARVIAALRGQPRLAVAGVNGPAHVVVSGERTALQAVVTRLAADGIRTQPLVVSHAFHSPLMDPVLDAFESAAGEVRFSAPRLTWISNLTGGAVAGAEAVTARYWRRHLREPVRFAEGMATIATHGCDVFLEIGPHPTLLAMGRECVDAEAVAWLPSLRRQREASAQLLDSVVALYARGARIDWAAFERGRGRRPVSLPTYPFERRRYWFAASPRPNRQDAPDGRGTHPLLGARLSSPLPEAQYQSRLGVAAPPFLDDHRVHGHAVLPAAAYVEMVVAAATQTHGGAVHTIEALTLEDALVLPDDGTVMVHLVLAPERDEGFSFQVSSLHAPDTAAVPAGPGAWRRHAAGRIRAVSAEAGVSTSDVDEIRRRCGTELAPAEFYTQLADRGFRFGPAFQGLIRLWQGTGEALGEASLVEGLHSEAYGLHPALLDACLQVVAAALPADAARPGSYLPFALDRCEIRTTTSRTLWSHARLRQPSATAEELMADIRIVDGDGLIVASLEGLRLRRADPSRLGRARVDPLDDCVYEMAWRPRPLDISVMPAAALVSPEEIAAHLRPRVPEVAAAHGLDRYDALLRQLDAMSTAYVTTALCRMGWKPEAGTAFEVDELASRLGVAPRQRRAFRRFLEMLAEDGLLHATDGAWRVVRRLDAVDGNVDEGPNGRPAGVGAELTLTHRVGGALVEALRGTADPLHLLFPGGSLADADALYRDAPAARAYADLTREALAAALGRWPAGRPLRVLEIGGGTGGTTRAVLAALPPAETEYVFTDVSPLFLSRALETFGARPRFRTGMLDIEREPSAQGFPAHGFDVVIAANVLHATRDLRVTLEHCRGLLAPGGLLLLLEVTTPQRWVDLTFGLTDGWWRFTDEHVRGTHPLLPAARWLDVLTAANFVDAIAVPDIPDGVLAQQALLLARAPAPDAPGRRRAEGRWLVIDDDGGQGARLASALKREGAEPILLSASEVESGPWRSGPPLRAVVYLGALDTVDDIAGEPEIIHRRVTGGLLRVLQVLLRSGQAPQFWLVTRGVHLVEDGAPPVVTAAPPWGVLRALAREHPQLRPRGIDLDPTTPDDDTDALLSELLAGDAEDQVALRAGTRRVLRIVPAAGRSSAPRALSVPAGGVLDDVCLVPAARRAPGPGEVEIEVRAAALNFADVLASLGMRSAPSGPLGGECAGVVSAVGPGVVDLSEGDEVIALAFGSFQSFVTTSARLVVPKPLGLSFESAAGIAIAFVTALHALRVVGGLRRGERALIHAATGGVGLAALQVARDLGADVLATAGSDAKRDTLRSMGVAHVMDSRSATFAADVMRATRGAGVHVVLNSLVGDLIAAGLSVLTSNGRFLEIGKREIWDADRVSRARPGVRYEAIDWSRDLAVDPESIRLLLVEAVEGVAAGRWRPLPVTSFPVERAAQAFRLMAQARHVGKVVLTFPGRRPIRSDATYLVTGGLGGLGLVVARWLVDQGARHVVLVGRNTPSPNAREAVEAMEREGARVGVAQADVSRRADIDAVLQRIATAGPPLRGVFLAAGVLDNGVLTEQSWERFWTVMAPKVAGAWHVHEATRDMPLDHFVLFSSASSVLGAPGQANHAAANSFLDALAAARRAQGLPAVSINWGAWSEVGAAARADVGRRIALAGMGTISPVEGLAALERAMDHDSAQVAVLRVDWAMFVERAAGGRRPPLLSEVPERTGALRAVTPRDGAGTGFRRRFDATPSGRQRAVLTSYVEDAVRRALGLEPSRPLERQRPLNELGLDSLMAVELRNRLASDLELSRALPATLIFDCPTVQAIADFLERELLGASAPPVIAPASTALGRIEQLSDDEVERLFAERTRGNGP